MQPRHQDTDYLPSYDQPGLVDDHAVRTDGVGSGGDEGEMAGETGGAGTLGGSKGKKRKTEDETQKKTRQSQSCDACRTRKVKCDRIPPGKPGAEIRAVCTHCQQLNLPCTFNYRPKKRGPPNQYLKRLQEDQSGSPNAPPFLQPIAGDNAGRSGGVLPQAPFVPANRTEPQLYTGYRDAGGPGPGSLSAFQDGNWEVDRWDAREPSAVRDTARIQANMFTYATPTSEFRSPLYSLSGAPSFPSSQSSPSTFRSPQMVSTDATPLQLIPARPNNPFDEILPRHLLLLIIELYFEYIYGLVPFIHRPSFMRDLHAYKEENMNDESADEWRALVMGLVAFTLVQIPRSFVPLKRKQVKEMVDVTSAIATQWLNRPYTVTCTVNRREQKFEDGLTADVILYMCMVTMSLVGRRVEGCEYTGRNWALITRGRCNMEETYKTISNPIESELMRRVFWLVVGGDKSLAVIEGVSTVASESSCADVALPSILEDEYITQHGLLEKKDDQPSILTGFYYICKLFRLTGQALDKRQLDRRSPPTGLLLQMRINEINEIYDQVMSLMDGCPPELRLNGDTSPRSAIFSDDWDLAAVKELRHFMLDPTANRSAVKDAFLVQQANIYVTQQMTRYVLVQYRDDLLALQQDELARATQVGSHDRFTSARRVDRPMFSEEEKEKVASDLLLILRSIPITVIAVNSIPLVWKVRFVASMLLDALEVGGSSTNAGEQSAKVQRAQRYLWDFLRILADIEALYSMDD